MKEHRPGLYSSFILGEKLYPHLLEIDRAARERKARDPMRWVGLMNTLKAQAEEVILAELIFD